MRTFNTLILFFVCLHIFSQEKFENEKYIDGIENYKTQELAVNIKKWTTIYGTYDVNINLSGTLITPKTAFNKVVVIISGTGHISQYAHNFLTEYLLKNNIGVFRFDKRGIGKSTGKASDFYQTYFNDFKCIYQVLKDSKILVNKKTGFLGHSLGGITSVMALKQALNQTF